MKRNSKIAIYIAAAAVIVAIILVVSLVIFVNTHDSGLYSFSFSENNAGEKNLSLKYYDCNGYSAKILESGEFDESLGSYCILVTIFDCYSVKTDHKINKIYDLNDISGNYKMKLYYLDVHTLGIYIGSDQPIHTETVEDFPRNFPYNIVNIKFS